MKRKREDWLGAGFELLVSKGVESITVETMARKLGVSKGGFYGYFINRNSFLQSMLDHWAETLTNQIIQSIEDNPSRTLQDKLQQLLFLVDDKKWDPLETSMYSWAIHDTKANRVVTQVVNERLVFMT